MRSSGVATLRETGTHFNAISLSFSSQLVHRLSCVT